MSIKDEDLPLYITLEGAAQSMHSTLIIAQMMIDQAIIHGILVPIDVHNIQMYQCVSKDTIEKVRNIMKQRQNNQQKRGEWS
jgi:hypothetical protein